MTILDEGYVIESTAPTVTIQYSYKALDCAPVMPGYFSIMPSHLRVPTGDGASRVEHGTYVKGGAA
jgi:hypothetical protein